MIAKAHEVEPPEGFQPVTIGGTFANRNGPLYARWTGQHMLLGFRVLPEHVNPAGQCHGGMLALFADMFLSTAGMYQTDKAGHFLPTVSLQTDFLAPSPLGAWIEGKADVLRMTRTLLFMHGLVHADGKPVLRASGVFKIGPLMPKSSDNQIIFRDAAPTAP